jgi:hypothetical protein
MEEEIENYEELPPELEGLTREELEAHREAVESEYEDYIASRGEY